MSGKAVMKAPIKRVNGAIVLAAALALGGCALWKHKPDPLIPAGADPKTFCPKTDPCNKIANRRQYFNQRENRYYYYDQTLGRYFWENGQPRFAEPGDPSP
jgi:hypothetical protein